MALLGRRQITLVKVDSAQNDMRYYSATYVDPLGAEDIRFSNDGTLLRTQIRGAAFAGTGFDSMELGETTPPSTAKKFRSSLGCLCDCTVTVVIPLPVVIENTHTVEGQLHVKLELGPPRLSDDGKDRGLESGMLQLNLTFGDRQVASGRSNSDFEAALDDIHRALPSGTFLKACYKCLYSDYSVSGHGLFGAMLCFRNIKDQYLSAKNKDEFLSIQTLFERQVQETYVCEDFRLRVAGTGYRG